MYRKEEVNSKFTANFYIRNEIHTQRLNAKFTASNSGDVN